MRIRVAWANGMKPRPILWVVGLWCLGVTGAFLLALPFEVLIHLAMH